jgi:hypothetical protein
MFAGTAEYLTNPADIDEFMEKARAVFKGRRGPGQ